MNENTPSSLVLWIDRIERRFNRRFGKERALTSFERHCADAILSCTSEDAAMLLRAQIDQCDYFDRYLQGRQVNFRRLDANYDTLKRLPNRRVGAVVGTAVLRAVSAPEEILCRLVCGEGRLYFLDFSILPQSRSLEDFDIVRAQRGDDLMIERDLEEQSEDSGYDERFDRDTEHPDE